MFFDDPVNWHEAQMLLALYARRRSRALEQGCVAPVSMAEYQLWAAFNASGPMKTSEYAAPDAVPARAPKSSRRFTVADRSRLFSLSR